MLESIFFFCNYKQVTKNIITFADENHGQDET